MPDKDNGLQFYTRFLQGDRNAMEELVCLYGDRLVRFAYCFVKDSAVAEDITEDAFVALIIKRKRFSDCDNLRAYLYKIVRNKALDYLRLHKKNIPMSDLENVLVGQSAEKDVVRRANNRALYKCMQQLPPQYEEVLYLTYFEDYSVGDVCKIVRRTKKQVYTLLARAKIALKELLVKEGVSYEDV